MILALFALAHAADFRSGAATVTLPWNDFQGLYQKWVEAEKPKPHAPRDWTLDRAVYAGKVVGKGEDAYALVHLSLRGTVHKRDGWTAVPLLSANAAMKAAKVDGKDAAVFVQSGWYTLLTDRPGAFGAEIDLAVKLFEADGETGFTLPLPESGATVLAFAVDSPEALTFEVPGAQGQDEVSVGTERRLEALLPPTGSATVSWRREVPEEEKRTARVYAEQSTLVGVSDNVLQVSANVDYTVLHAGVDHFKVQVPSQATVLDVRGAGIRDWKQAADGTIEVQLNYGAEGLYRLSVDYEKSGAPGGEIPLMRVYDVARETDWIGVDARSALELVAGAPSGAVPVDVRELPASILGQTDFPVLLAFKGRGGEIKLPLEVKSHPDVDMLVTLVDTASAETLVTEDGRRMTRVRYAVRNNRKQFLRLLLPEGAEVWTASVAGRGVKVSKGDGGVLVPLVRSDASGGALTAFAVEVVYVEKGSALKVGSGEEKVELPRVDAPTSQVAWTVYFPAEAKVAKRGAQGTLHRVEYFSAGPQIPDSNAVPMQFQQQMNAEVAQQGAAGALGQGVEPVEVSLPLTGQQLYFEKMLALDEKLWVSFDYRWKPRR
jgi:hypothetical protein